jgi:hypothetical protein
MQKTGLAKNRVKTFSPWDDVHGAGRKTGHGDYPAHREASRS